MDFFLFMTRWVLVVSFILAKLCYFESLMLLYLYVLVFILLAFIIYCAEQN